MPTAYAISVAAAALTLNPNDEAARAAMARALARAGTTANNNDTNTPEEKNDASAELRPDATLPKPFTASTLLAALAACQSGEAVGRARAATR